MVVGLWAWWDVGAWVVCYGFREVGCRVWVGEGLGHLFGVLVGSLGSTRDVLVFTYLLGYVALGR